LGLIVSRDSNQMVDDHFGDATKMVEIDSSANAKSRILAGKKFFAGTARSYKIYL